MLLQTNSYIVPKDKRNEHARLLRRFRQTLLRLGCDHFEVYEQVGANWNTGETTGRFVQILRFRDRKHQLAVQGAERTDPQAQQLVAEFCELINFPYQQQQGLFAVGFYTSFLKMPPQRTVGARPAEEEEILDINPPINASAEPGVPPVGAWSMAGQGEPESASETIHQPVDVEPIEAESVPMEELPQETEAEHEGSDTPSMIDIDPADVHASEATGHEDQVSR